MFRFLHAADIHLDSPLRGLSRYPGAPVDVLRTATREAFRKLIDHAIDEAVAFVVIAGDLYDGDWLDVSTGIYLVEQLGRLDRAGIRAVLLSGNHDAENRITRDLPLPGNAFRFGSRKPETFRFDDIGVALHGQSFARRDMTDNLAASYPKPLPDLFNIGVLHTALEGNAEHAPYAPCSLEELRNKGYAYWALGHVHRRQILSTDPHVVFPGNLQGRHARETGPKGATLITVDDARVTGLEAIAFDVVRWARIDVDIGGVSRVEEASRRIDDALDEALQSQADGRLLAVRVRLTGRTPLHGEFARDEAGLRERLLALASAIGWDRVWPEKLELATEPPRTDAELRGREDALGDLRRMLDGARDDAELAALVKTPLDELWSRLPAELKNEIDWTAEGGPLARVEAGDAAALAEDVAPWLLARLAGSEA